MRKHIYDEKNGLRYMLRGDYYLPELEMPEDEIPCYGKYGILRRRYLKNYKNGLYVILFMEGELVKHLNEIDCQAKVRLEYLMNAMADQQGVTEQLKAQDPMRWVGLMNNIKNSAEEIVLEELIYG